MYDPISTHHISRMQLIYSCLQRTFPKMVSVLIKCNVGQHSFNPATEPEKSEEAVIWRMLATQGTLVSGIGIDLHSSIPTEMLLVQIVGDL